MANKLKKDKYCKYTTSHSYVDLSLYNSPIFGTKEELEKWHREVFGLDGAFRAIDSLIEAEAPPNSKVFGISLTSYLGATVPEMMVHVTFETPMTEDQRKKVDLRIKRTKELAAKRKEAKKQEDLALLKKLQEQYKDEL